MISKVPHPTFVVSRVVAVGWVNDVLVVVGCDVINVGCAVSFDTVYYTGYK